MSDTTLFLCGVGVILVVFAAIVVMVSTIYAMAEGDEHKRIVKEGVAAANPTGRMWEATQ